MLRIINARPHPKERKNSVYYSKVMDTVLNGDSV